MPESNDSGITRQTLRDLLPVIVLGFILVVIGLFVLLWPTGAWGTENNVSVPHLQRLLGDAGGSAVPLTRRILDASIYLVVLLGIGFVGVALRRSTRDTMIGLIAVSILGLAYVSGQALYAGPMMSACGFLFILFGSFVAWIASSANDPKPAEPNLPAEHEKVDDTGSSEPIGVGNNDYASSSVA